MLKGSPASVVSEVVDASLVTAVAIIVMGGVTVGIVGMSVLEVVEGLDTGEARLVVDTTVRVMMV